MTMPPTDAPRCGLTPVPLLILHPLQIQAIEAFNAKCHAEYIAQCRQRQQRRRKHGRSGRFDREDMWHHYLRQETGLRGAR